MEVEVRPEISVDSSRRAMKSRPNALEVMDLSRRYGETLGLMTATVSLAQGAVLGVIGSNGSGKSTFLRCASLFEEPDSGSVRIMGANLSHSDCFCVPQGHLANSLSDRPPVGVVFQDSAPWPHLTVLQNVVLPLVQGSNLQEKDAEERALHYLGIFGLLDRVSAFPRTLSGGLRQRVVLARAFARNPWLLFIDEGTSALDPAWTERVRSEIRDFANNGGSAVVVTHQMGFARRVADSIVFFDRGRLAETGTPHILDNPGTSELAEFLRSA